MSANTNQCQLWFGIVTLFPEMFEAVTCYGVTGKAVDRGIVEVQSWNPKDFTDGKPHRTDDTPFGGGPGMLMTAEPLRAALAAARAAAPADTKAIYLSPQGKQLTQTQAQTLSRAKGLILLAGRYEGVDERVIQLDIDEEWSIGDYVLTGGELPAMTLMDVLIRLLPGVVGDAQSVVQDSFSDNLLDCPHFTKPRQVGNLDTPEVLLSGDHQAIKRWRLQQSLGRTFKRRPDLLQERELSELEQQLLAEYLQQQNQ